MNGFDIVVLANHNTLNPINYAMGNVLTSPTVLVVCVGGKPVFPSPPAPPCSSSLPDTFELAAAMSGSLTPSPTTGLLFTVVYNITGTTPSLNGIPVGFATGCSASSSSVSGTTTCVNISNGSFTPIPETVQGATFVTPRTLSLSFKGVTFALTSNLVNDTSHNKLVGTIQVTATNTTTGQVILTRTYNVNLTFPGKNQIIPADHSIRFVLDVSSLGDGILCSSSPPSAPTIECFATYTPDVYHLGQINIIDAGAVAFAFGSLPGSPHWNSNFDFDLDGYIGLNDVSVEFLHYGAAIIT